MGKAELINRFLDVIITSISSLFVLDWMSVKMGKAMTGLFAFGSAGTLALTLASQGLVTQLLSGLVLIFGNKMCVKSLHTELYFDVHACSHRTHSQSLPLFVSGVRKIASYRT